MSYRRNHESRSPVPAVQRIGYFLLGAAVIGIAVGVFANVIYKRRGAEIGSEVVVLTLGVLVCGVVIAYGVFLLKQGGRRKR